MKRSREVITLADEKERLYDIFRDKSFLCHRRSVLNTDFCQAPTDQ